MAECALSLPMDQAQPESSKPMIVPVMASTVHLVNLCFIALPSPSNVPSIKLRTDADRGVRRSSPVDYEARETGSHPGPARPGSATPATPRGACGVVRPPGSD